MLRSSRPECIKVAVLDRDDTWIRKVRLGLGASMGASVESVDNPKEFLSNGAMPPHVVVLSAHLDPDFSTVRRLREKWNEQQLPIIVTDGIIGDEDAQAEATRAGANAFFDRSIHKDDLTLLEKLVYGLAHV